MEHCSALLGMTGQHEESRDSERINCTSSIEQGLQYLVLQKKRLQYLYNSESMPELMKGGSCGRVDDVRAMARGVRVERGVRAFRCAERRARGRCGRALWLAEYARGTRSRFSSHPTQHIPFRVSNFFLSQHPKLGS
jgi:hypothetical protein